MFVTLLRVFSWRSKWWFHSVPDWGLTAAVFIVDPSLSCTSYIHTKMENGCHFTHTLYFPWIRIIHEIAHHIPLWFVWLKENDYCHCWSHSVHVLNNVMAYNWPRDCLGHTYHSIWSSRDWMQQQYFGPSTDYWHNPVWDVLNVWIKVATILDSAGDHS